MLSLRDVQGFPHELRHRFQQAKRNSLAGPRQGDPVTLWRSLWGGPAKMAHLGILEVQICPNKERFLAAPGAQKQLQLNISRGDRSFVPPGFRAAPEHEKPVFLISARRTNVQSREGSPSSARPCPCVT